MIDNKILDAILRPLADQYEAGNRHWIPITPESSEEYEPLRETLATLRAEGSTVISTLGHYHLTPSGYAKYADRIKALRTLS